MYEIERKHIVKSLDDKLTFYKLLKSDGLVGKDQIQILNFEIYSGVVSHTIGNNVVNPKQIFKFNGCIHSKIIIHLDWSISQFTKTLLEDIKTSIQDRIELMSEEAGESEASIDPCLISTENAPRLTDISLFYPQRIYCRHNVQDLDSAREVMPYSDYMLIWEEDYIANKRVRSMTGIVPEIQMIEKISTEDK